MIDADLVVRNISELLTSTGPGPFAGARQREVSSIRDAAIASKNGRIVYVGSSKNLTAQLAPTREARIVDATGLSMVPGFVDAHTHAIYAGDRRAELRRRLAGATYAEIATTGGGIVSTVAATRAASKEDLVAQSRARLEEMLNCGTTTCEVKSGYGLNVEAEMKMLRAAHSLASSQPIDLSITFMGAHEIPLEYRERRTDYVDLIVDRMIPEIAAAGLAEWCDVFCETGVFTPEESTRILEAGVAHGLKPRIHADELEASGGSQVAARVGARSADHLIFVPSAGIAAMAAAGVTATLLPNAAFYLKLGRWAPARALIEAGVPVALATDVNPGGGFSPSMPFAISLACFGMEMTFEEALVAATANSAWSLDRFDVVGTLEPGKLMDAVLVGGEPINLIRNGAPSIAAVIKRGRIVRGEDALGHDTHR